MPNPLTSIQLEFIFENKGRMKQVDIAKELNVSPAVVNQKIRARKAKVVVMDSQYFDIDLEWKKHYSL